jgi:hypothetical protein
MRAAVHFAGFICAAFGVACAPPVAVEFDERVDIARYRAWDWLPRAAGSVDAPENDAPALDERLARLVERALQARGFERKRGRAEFFVSYYLRVEREVVSFSETPAIQELSSHHSSPSYQIQATRRELRTYEKGHLAIVVAGVRQRRVIWRGDFEERFRDDFAPHLEEAVQNILDRFPRADPGAAPPTPPSDSFKYSSTRVDVAGHRASHARFVGNARSDRSSASTAGR